MQSRACSSKSGGTCASRLAASCLGRTPAASAQGLMRAFLSHKVVLNSEHALDLRWGLLEIIRAHLQGRQGILAEELSAA